MNADSAGRSLFIVDNSVAGRPTIRHAVLNARRHSRDSAWARTIFDLGGRFLHEFWVPVRINASP